MPFNKPPRRLKNFVIAGKKYSFERLFYLISTSLAVLSSTMSNILNPLIRKTKVITYLDVLFAKSKITDTMLKALKDYHNCSETKTLNSPDKSFSF